MNFIKLTTLKDTNIYINFDNVAAFCETKDKNGDPCTSVSYLDQGEYFDFVVKEKPEIIMEKISEIAL